MTKTRNKYILYLLFVLTLTSSVYGQQWEKGILTLKNGHKIEGTFLFNETLFEGAILEKNETDSTKSKIWPPLKVQSVDFSDKRIETVRTKLGQMRAKNWVLVEKLFTGEKFNVIKRRIPEGNTSVLPIFIGGGIWLARVQELQYLQLYFITDKQGHVWKMNEDTAIWRVDTKVLINTLDIDKKQLKAYAKANKLKLHEPEHLVQIVKHAETLIP